LDISKVKVPQDVFDIAQEKLQSDPDKYKGTNFKCQFDIKGSTGGYWYVLANDEKKEINKGQLANPIATVIMKDSDFIKLVLGRLNAPMALLTGKIKIKGDMNHIMKLVDTVLS
jgi:putative sterol carrier protein